MDNRTRVIRLTSFAWLLAGAALLSLGGVGQVAAQPFPTDPTAVPKASCGSGDLPETGDQGDVPLADESSGRFRLGYRCNLVRVGYSDINGQGLGGSWQVTWYKDCAYVETDPAGGSVGTEIAVVDASNPAKPRVTEIFPNPVVHSHEGLHAIGSRGILAVSAEPSFQDVTDAPPATAFYDIATDCTHPRLLNVFQLGVPAEEMVWHSGTVSADGRTLYETSSTQGPCLTIIDIGDVMHPKALGTFGTQEPCHDLDLSADGKTAYVGSYGVTRNDGETATVFVPFLPDLGDIPAPGDFGLTILDVSDIQNRVANPQIRTLSTLNTGRAHTQSLAHIGSRTYAFEAEEGDCVNGVGKVVDVTDPANPVVVSTLALEAQVDLMCPSWTLQKGDGLQELLPYSTHYFGFNSDEDRFSADQTHRDGSVEFMSAYGMGLRAFDVHDPSHPVEIGYFNAPLPSWWTNSYPAAATSWIRYRSDSGYIWYGDRTGFEILRFDHGVGPAPTSAAYCAAWLQGATTGRLAAIASGQSACAAAASSALATRNTNAGGVLGVSTTGSATAAAPVAYGMAAGTPNTSAALPTAPGAPAAPQSSGGSAAGAAALASGFRTQPWVPLLVIALWALVLGNLGTLLARRRRASQVD